MSEIYFLAEIGVNHEGSQDLAIEMIRTASIAGANGVKFQCYKAETLAAINSPIFEKYFFEIVYGFNFSKRVVSIFINVDILCETACFNSFKPNVVFESCKSIRSTPFK